jgi:hypothetical protein
VLGLSRSVASLDVTSLAEIRKLWAPYRCIDSSSEPKAQVILWGKKRGFTPTICLDGWSALESTLLASGYRVPVRAEVRRPCSQGIKKKPCESSGKNCSTHNYGLAVDIDPFGEGNPHFEVPFGGPKWDFSDTRITRSQVEAVERIKTKEGVRVFRWLGWTIGDTMHFEFNLGPKALEAGIDSGTVLVPGGAPPFESGEEVKMTFTAEEEDFLKDFVKVVSVDMGSSRHFAKSAILDIRKDVITRDELVKLFTDLPEGSVEEAHAELLKRLKAKT